MTPEKATQLKTHLAAIAQLLYEESDPADMQTLEITTVNSITRVSKR
ncbi:hypothetical protein [Leptolyngbya sp. KIOST-1]|nr:hypothetical protein [Leptolyngbya sp. KIOST-1]